jgi:hypothetical protein
LILSAESASQRRKIDGNYAGNRAKAEYQPDNGRMFFIHFFFPAIAFLPLQRKSFRAKIKFFRLGRRNFLL